MLETPFVAAEQALAADSLSRAREAWGSAAPLGHRKMHFVTQPLSRLPFTAVLVILATSIFVHGQTSSELRSKYGEPQMTKLKDNLPEVERFLVRPNILMTIKYTRLGQPLEAVLEPLPNSTPKEGRRQHAPEGDYMSTVEVVKLLNELVSIEKRGKKISELFINGRDPEMKLHHPGCSGVYVAYFENAWFTCSTWCRGGTFSATIHWGKSSLPWTNYKNQ